MVGAPAGGEQTTASDVDLLRQTDPTAPFYPCSVVLPQEVLLR